MNHDDLKEWLDASGDLPLNKATDAVWMLGNSIFEQANRLEQQVLAQISMNRATARVIKILASCIKVQVEKISQDAIADILEDFEKAMQPIIHGTSDTELLRRYQSAMRDCVEVIQGISENQGTD